MSNHYANSNHALKPEIGSGPGHEDPFTFASIPFNPTAIDRRPLPIIDAPGVTPIPIASQIQTAAQRRENAKARRRVPTSQRKRTKLSCDACKAKRCKCLRTGPTPESDDGQDDKNLAPCKTCVDLGIECVTTLPRKQRIYGSVEQLDRRYRALDNLVAGMCPDLPSDATAEELVEYGKQRGIPMPDLAPTNETSRSPTTTMAGVVSPISPPIAGQRIGDDDQESDLNNAHFLKDTSGRSYYIGPSGSLASFARIRDLIARRLQASGGPDAGRLVQHLSSKSVTDTIARSFDETPNHVVASAPKSSGYFDSNLASSTRNIDRKVIDSGDMNSSRSWIATSKIKLPSKELADACVNAFFDHVHADFMIFHRPTFQQHYDDLWKSSPRLQGISAHSMQRQSHVSVGWLCCLYMIFIMGSRSLPQDEKSLDFQRTWYEAVKELPSLLVSSTLPNVCGLMLLALYFQGTNDRTKSWVYIGAACRLAIALGMHQESANEGMEPVVKEIRKRVWWTLYDYEQHLCCSLGRPSAIDDAEVNAGVPDESMLKCMPNFSPGHMRRWVNLIRLQSAIRRDLYTPDPKAASVVPRAVQLLRQLGSWKADLPRELEATPPNCAHLDPAKWRRIMLLQVQYQKNINLLTRRFLLKEVESVDRRESLGNHAFIIIKLAKICVTSAMRSSDLLVDLWRAGQFNGSTWLDTYYAYLSSIQICLRLLEPSTPGPNPHEESGRPLDWKFQPRVTDAESDIPQPRTELDFEVEALIAQWNLIEEHSAAQLTDAVRGLHDLLKTVRMSGFSAKCEAIASEFAKVVGAVNGKPSSTLFGGHLGQHMDHVADSMHDPSLAFNNHLEGAPLFSGIPVSEELNSVGHVPNDFHSTQLAHAADPSVTLPMTTSMSNTNVMDYVYSGVLDADSLRGVPVSQQPQIQWDMVQPPEEWSERNGMPTDMIANSWFWPSQGEFPYHPMDSPQ